MVRIGIAGLGFMGRRHFEIYQAMQADKARVVAVAEPDGKKRSGDWSDTTGNIGPGGGVQNLGGVRRYESVADLVADPEIDVIDITLPTFLHREVAIAALAAGKHVVCEKPMSLQYGECEEMMRAAEKASRQIYVGHCLRFWPAYARAAELIMGGDLGKTLTARFARFSAIPTWGWNNWATDQERSGGAPLDLHIHDADFIAYLFGRPRAVTAFTGGGGRIIGALDHIAAFYDYGDERLVYAEAGWEYSSGHPFSMTFDVHMEKGTLTLDAEGGLTLYRDGRQPEALEFSSGDGWTHELAHFMVCAAAGKPSSVIRCDEAAFAVKLVRAEIESAKRRERVEI